MNHPDRSTWIDYLYDEELPAGQRRQLEAHLAECPACRTQLSTWKEVGTALSSLPDPAPIRRAPGSRLPVSWLAAAAALVALGVVAGRLLFPASPDLAQVRAQLLPALRDELRAELAQATAPTNTATLSPDEFKRLLAAYASSQETHREQDLRELYAAIARVDRQRAADYTTLRQGMETMAVLTDATFRQTSEQLVQLAGYSGNTTPLQ